MNRSPDDIFAAQFWAWPDPALKRDAHGRVLFVNAAFLQLFGGTVDAWRGQVVQGWNPPQPGPHPSRFEIRTPATDYMPEQVYDWLEQSGRDGSAFALARNVTAFAAPPVPQAYPAANADPAQTQTQAANQAPVQAEPEPQADPVSEAPAVPDAAPIDPTAYVVAAVAEAAPETAPEPTAQAQAPEIAVAPPVQADPPQPQPEPAPSAPAEPAPIEVAPPAAQSPEQSSPAQPAAVQTATTQAPTTQAQTTQAPSNFGQDMHRDFERRALPIEDDEAVLGSNWRDAVIAKATGAEGESADPAALMDDGGAAPAPAGNGIRILLAEDNAINALLTRTLLEADGHTVETVEDGVLAVEAMKTSTYDMIFMDMRMPNMDGLEATRNIRRLSNVPQDLPIVALTANAFDDDRNACFDSGMNDFMTKPVSAEELSEMVVRWTKQVEQKMAS